MQFKNIKFSVLSLLYGPNLTSIHDYQKNYSFVYGPLSSKRYLCFLIHCLDLSGEGNGNPLQYSCLENSMDEGAWWATVHGITKSRTRMSDFTFTFYLPRELSSKESACQCKKCGFDPWVGNISWRRKWQPAPVFLPGEPHGQRSLVG